MILFDAIIPGNTLLGYANADHWAIAIPVTHDMPNVAKTLITRNAFPREVLLEAIVRFVEETLLESTGQSRRSGYPPVAERSKP